MDTLQIGECAICGLRGRLQEIEAHVQLHFANEPGESSYTGSQDIEVGLPLTAPNAAKTAGDSPLHWSRQETLALISLVKDNYDALSTQIKKKVWSKIATELSALSKMKLTWGQCDSKWKGLKKTYKNIKDHNAKSGNDHKKWEYYTEMDDVIGQKPEVSPVATCSSSRGLSSSAHSSGTSKSPSDEEDFESSFTSKRRKLSTESPVERRHREKMDRQDKFLELFEKYLEKK